MVGLDKFREAFEAYADNYVIIGGTTCEIVMDGTAVRSRATHDIDMIIVVERMTTEFGQRFWQFIQDAGYRPERYKAAEGEKARYQLYRFVDGKSGYPEMIELLSRYPDILGEPKDLKIEPIPIDYWIYGHSHRNIDALIGRTQCISNQLGYVFANEAHDFNHSKYIKL